MTEDASHSRSLRLLINDDGDGQTAARPRRCCGSSPKAMTCCSAAELLVAGGGCWLFNYCFHNPYCGVLFRCHCTWPWAGGAQRCNVHHLSGPKCPWCNVRNTALAALAWAISDNFTVCMMVLSYVAVMLLQRQRTRHWLPTSKRQLAMRVSTAMATFLALGFAMGLVFYAGTDYPCFLWIADNATRCGWQGARAEKFT